MKKLKGLILLATFVGALTLGSCRSNKPICPAYKTSNDVEMPQKAKRI